MSRPNPQGTPQPREPSRWEECLPVLDLSAGVPDPVAIATWQLALANLVQGEVPHELLGLWVFPDSGGVVLLGPAALAADHLTIPRPQPHLTQDQLFELEQILRRAKYASAIAVPVRDPARDRDVAFLLLGAFAAGCYDAQRALVLHRLAKRLAPSLSQLARLITAVGSQAALEPSMSREDLPQALARASAEAPSGPELVRRVGGILHPLVPHDRLELLSASSPEGPVVPLGGTPVRRRWGTPSGSWSQLAALLADRLREVPTAAIGDVEVEAPGLIWPSGSGAHARVVSLLAARLDLGGSRVGYLLLGSAARELYRPADEEAVELAAQLLAPRVVALRLAVELETLRGQLEALQAPTLPLLRAAEVLATTAHLGEALHRFSEEVRERVPHERIRYHLLLGEDDVVELVPEAIRPLADLPVVPLGQSPARAILASDQAWAVVQDRERSALLVPLQLADRVIGAMALEAEEFPSPREQAAVAQQFAAILAPHLELVRRGARSEGRGARSEGVPGRH